MCLRNSKTSNLQDKPTQNEQTQRQYAWRARLPFSHVLANSSSFLQFAINKKDQRLVIAIAGVCAGNGYRAVLGEIYLPIVQANHL
jgi:hypothetical protein